MWVLNYKFFGLLLLISVVLLVIRKKQARQFLIYVLAYPLIILFWKIPKLCIRNWALLIAFAPAIHEIFISFRFTFIITTIAALSALLIILTSNKYFIIPAMAILGFYLAVKLYRSLKKSYRSSIFEGLADFAKKTRLRIESGEDTLWKKVDYDPTAESKEYEEQLSSFYFLHSGLEIISNKLHEVAKSRKPDLYLFASWIWIIFITSLIYALEYLALHKINPMSFSPGYRLSFWDFLGYSFGMLVRYSISSIRSVSTLASILSYSELLCSLIILVILVFSGFNVRREKYREDIDDFIKELRDLGSEMQRQFCLLYNLALPDIEGFLLRTNASLINWLRKSRGLPPLQLPEEDE
jgi:hypothetical protein